jgi:GNAT superfamily N-acetyltransferase
MATPQPRFEVQVRPLVERDLPDADRIVRLAFGKFLGSPDPVHLMGDADFACTRWRADPSAALAAEYDGKVIGSSFATNWGSFGFFGPLTVHPDYWDRGVAQQLLVPTMRILDGWRCRHLGLHTFSLSPKHMALYQKFGFWPRNLVALMSKEIGNPSDITNPETVHFSAAGPQEQEKLLAACREVTDQIFEGLDVSREISAVFDQHLGDTLLIWDRGRLAAFAVCHAGPGTEAGSGVCYVKFAAVQPSRRAGANLYRLLDACESFGRAGAAHKIVAGINLARREAYDRLFTWGFRADSMGVAMETGDESSGYNRADMYILDDWR